MKNPKLEQYLARIRAIEPEIQIKTAKFNDEGLVNDVLIVNDALVYRFAKNSAGMTALKAEVHVLDVIRPYVQMPIPNPFYTHPELVAYPLLKGKSLTRAVLARLSDEDRLAVWKQMAAFLRELYSVPIDQTLPMTTAPVLYSDWVRIYEEAEKAIYPLLMKHQRDWAERLFNDILGSEGNFQYEPVIIHGDLSCYHILFDLHAQRLSGIIDFGVAGVGDPANDVACLIQYYGETSIRQMLAWVPELDERTVRRAHFYAQAIELQWVLNGVRSGEMFWFTAHIGNNRDIEE